MNDKTVTKDIVDAEIEFNKPIIEDDSQALMPAQAPPQMLQTQQDRFVEMALQSGDMGQLEKMLALKERYDKEEARKAFTAALAGFKSEGVEIKKDRLVSFENNDKSMTTYTHASLGNIVKTAVPLMAKHGLSHRWDIEQLDGGAVSCKCILTHEGGHSEETKPIKASPDESGKKNNIQKIASTMTYLERYTFLEVTGLAVEEQDDDGVASGSPVVAPEVETISDDQIKTLDARITDNNLDEKLFTGWLAKKCPYTTGKIDKLAVDNYSMVLARLDKTIKLKHDKEDQAE